MRKAGFKISLFKRLTPFGCGRRAGFASAVHIVIATGQIVRTPNPFGLRSNAVNDRPIFRSIVGYDRCSLRPRGIVVGTVQPSVVVGCRTFPSTACCNSTVLVRPKYTSVVAIATALHHNSADVIGKRNCVGNGGGVDVWKVHLLNSIKEEDHVVINGYGQGVRPFSGDSSVRSRVRSSV